MATEGFAARVAAELRAERARTRITFAELAESAGLSKTAVMHYLNARRAIPLPAFFELCSALGVSPTVIFERAEEGSQKH
ncbi:helix-turn-helix domain-containing protein [Agrococcus sp. DT81.2]|uniref:helix-turn-helix domain-containing protein n=1 Tax=Agrococcus sp. DT81.2 TaxID=3393414 RepID=UPI003CE5B513